MTVGRPSFLAGSGSGVRECPRRREVPGSGCMARELVAGALR